MTAGKYTLHRRALLALNELTQKEKDQVMATLVSLADSPTAEWVPKQAKPFDDDQALYLVRASRQSSSHRPCGRRPEKRTCGHCAEGDAGRFCQGSFRGAAITQRERCPSSSRTPSSWTSVGEKCFG